MKHTECKDCEWSNGDCGYHFKMDGFTNYDIASLSVCDQYGNCEFFKSKANPQGDLISREALKKHKFVGNKFVQIGGRTNGKTLESINKAYQQGWNDCIDAIIDNAPTVEPEITEYDLHCAMTTGYKDGFEMAKAKFERPQGAWIFRQGVTCGGYYKCNKCGEVERAEKNYCSNCGAYMKGKKNENKD